MLIPFGVFSAAGAGGGGAAGAYELISTTLISTNTASVTFDVSSYASTYKHLQVRFTSRVSIDQGIQPRMTFNSDTASNYSRHQLTGDGSSVSSFGGANATNMFLGATIPGNSTSNAFSAHIVDILNFASTSVYKTMRCFSGCTPVNDIKLTSGNWRSTSAITSITIDSLDYFVSGSRFSIYGIKGA